jgi:transcriptional regulator with XRE-family HTH domain
LPTLFALVNRNGCIVPNMGVSEQAETEFRKIFRRERDSRNWSQAHVAKLLADKGLAVYPSTVAKIEAGERAVRIDEIAALADIFGVSVGALVGHSVQRTRAGDKALTLNALARLAQHTVGQAESLEATLRDRLADLDSFDLRKDERTAQAECEHACDALGDAVAATRKATTRLQRIQKRMVTEFLLDDTHTDGDDK